MGQILEIEVPGLEPACRSCSKQLPLKPPYNTAYPCKEVTLSGESLRFPEFNRGRGFISCEQYSPNLRTDLLNYSRAFLRAFFASLPQ